MSTVAEAPVETDLRTLEVSAGFKLGGKMIGSHFSVPEELIDSHLGGPMAALMDEFERFTGKLWNGLLAAPSWAYPPLPCDIRLSSQWIVYHCPPGGGENDVTGTNQGLARMRLVFKDGVFDIEVLRGLLATFGNTTYRAIRTLEQDG